MKLASAPRIKDYQKAEEEARAQADATKLSAEAAAAQDRIALDQAIIDKLPDMLRAAAEGLQGANVTVLDGAEGLNSVVASLAAQGLTMLDTIRAGLRPEPGNAIAPISPKSAA